MIAQKIEKKRIKECVSIMTNIIIKMSVNVTRLFVGLGFGTFFGIYGGVATGVGIDMGCNFANVKSEHTATAVRGGIVGGGFISGMAGFLVGSGIGLSPV